MKTMMWIGLSVGLLNLAAHAAESFSLAPSLHITAAAGDTSAEEGALALGHHDPTREDGTVQGIEAGLSLRTDFHLEGFATYTFYYGLEEEWEDELEEGFLKLTDLPGGLELRGGRLLARYGRHNTRHLHAWDRVDMPMVQGRFLGDDGLIIDGADLTWSHQGMTRTFGLVVGYGDVKAHDHDHGHDEGGFNSDVYMARAFSRWQPTDFYRYDAGVSFVLGENGYHSDTTVVGLDGALTWRENGLEAGGRSLVWETEVMLRMFDAAHHGEHHDDDAEHDYDHEAEHDHDHEAEHDHEEASEDMESQTELGFETSLTYGFNDQFNVGAQAGWVSGLDDLGVDERWRLSPVLTYKPGDQDYLSLRLQYNYDILEATEEHSVWAQINISLGGPEVR